ncbi:MAG: 50S ribosomal protein L21 [Pirellulaceae bacterium]|nr:50S ribosomal protein L21 [Pirellulaceae bacterium]
MYAIFVDGSRQYRVEPGQTLDIDYREGSETGDSLKFENVLAIGGDEGLRLGTPSVAGASVTATVLGIEKGEKLYIQKFRRRKNSKRRTGHRQMFTRIEIGQINA